MIGKLAFPMVCLLIASGCAEQRLAKAQAQFNDAVAECKLQFPPKIGNYVTRAECINAASVKFSPPEDTLAALFRAKRLSVSARVDRGQISPEDAALEYAEYVNNRRSEAHAQSASIRAQNAANAAAVLQGLSEMQTARPAPYAPYVMPVQRPFNMNCQTMGATTNCTGN